jgi:hypothetical protein
MSQGTPKSLSRRDFDAVIRRAAELSSSDPGGSEQLTEAELFRIAGEVGLSDRHVRMALTEVRSGVSGGGPLERIFGPALIRASRVVPANKAELVEQVDNFLVASQLLQRVRKGASILQYRPAVDWASQLARAASFSSRKYYVASAKSVEVHLEEVDDQRTLVEFVVEPGTRADAFAAAGFGGGAVGVGLGIAAGASLMAVAPVALATGIGVGVGGGLASAITYGVGVNHRKKLDAVRDEVEGILDRLEARDSLEPPPSSWRRWVKRNFHGMARDLLSADDDL